MSMFDNFDPTPTHVARAKEKGEANGLCNRGACQTDNRVVFYHRLNHNYYCQPCAFKINDGNMDWDGKPLCYIDVEADIVCHMDLGKEHRDPKKYKGDEVNRHITQEYVFSYLEDRKYLYVRGLETIKRYLEMTDNVVRDGDLVNVAGIKEAIIFGDVHGTVMDKTPYRTRYPTPPKPEPREIDRIQRRSKSMIVMGTPHLNSMMMLDYLRTKEAINKTHIMSITDEVRNKVLDNSLFSSQAESRVHRKSQAAIMGDFSKVEEREMALICEDAVMPEDGTSKLDYKARYKRIGDMIRDTQTGQLIPVRKCPKDIKRALGIR